MKKGRQAVCCQNILTAACLSFFLFFPTLVSADTVTLKNGKTLKGLVVEKHADRIILSTEKGERPILRSGITNIQYADAESNFMEIGKKYEAENKSGEALAYYEKALEVNPDFEEAKKAAIGVRNRFWAITAEGPRNEMEKKQVLYDSWEKRTPVGELLKRQTSEQAQALKENLGIGLEKRGDWVRVSVLDPKKDAFQAGLRKYDRLVAADGDSLRYLSAEVVGKKFIAPRHSSFTLEFERDCFVKRTAGSLRLKDLGFKVALRYEGIIVESVQAGSLAESANLREGDLLVRVNGVPTRYTPIKELENAMGQAKEGKLVLTIRRSALITRR